MSSSRDSDTSARLHRWWVWFFIVGAFIGGLGFSFKIFQFTDDLLAEEGIQFAGVHLLTYCLVAGGFLALLVYAFLKGHFSDIEKPKYDLLDRERQYDHDGSF